MNLRKSVLLCAALALGLIPLFASYAPALPAQTFTSLGKINPPSTTGFDISFVDNGSNTYILGDRSNAGVDIVNALTGAYIGIMKGTGALAFHGTGTCNPVFMCTGPEGVLIDKHGLIWGGDGDSTDKWGALATATTTGVQGEAVTCPTAATIAHGETSTAACLRADEQAYDPADDVILIANPDATPQPFLSFISDADANRGTILSQYFYPSSQSGLEQPVWDPVTKLFYQAVPGKGVDAFDPHTFQLVHTIYTYCVGGPTGLALGNGELGGACTDGGIFIKLVGGGNGYTATLVSQVGGADEVWFNPGDGNFYYARSTPGQLGVVAGGSDTFVTNLPTLVGSHSVAADANNNHIFVPVNDGSGIIVYQSNAPQTGTIAVQPSSGTETLNSTFQASVVLSGNGQAITSASATVNVSPNFTVLSVQPGNCPITYTTTPTTANPSFAGTLPAISQTTTCTLYTLVLQVTNNRGGSGSISLSNAQLMNPGGHAILTTATNGQYTLP